ncbi:hypothetical protein DSM3645_16330 [Blastopirellula marina DSM 3645]|uniref:Uncharacterized protein n=1 Tax=Blastopirellula marina DSM 3645 TaxID=314230 RepID=A3ZZT3_9BACT|nr:hypothetical protein DSM3645_16330 [Blastopirellula marina DSM 3645]
MEDDSITNNPLDADYDIARKFDSRRFR